MERLEGGQGWNRQGRTATSGSFCDGVTCSNFDLSTLAAAAITADAFAATFASVGLAAISVIRRLHHINTPHHREESGQILIAGTIQMHPKTTTEAGGTSATPPPLDTNW